MTSREVSASGAIALALVASFRVHVTTSTGYDGMCQFTLRRCGTFHSIPSSILSHIFRCNIPREPPEFLRSCSSILVGNDAVMVHHKSYSHIERVALSALVLRVVMQQEAVGRVQMEGEMVMRERKWEEKLEEVHREKQELQVQFRKAERQAKAFQKDVSARDSEWVTGCRLIQSSKYRRRLWVRNCTSASAMLIRDVEEFD